MSWGIFTKEELGEINQLRQSIYIFLSRIYREEIDQGLLNSLEGEYLSKSFTEPDITQGWEIIKDFLTKVTKDSIRLLATEYTSIFLGTGENPAYPFESVYLTKHRLEMQRPRDEVMRIYRAEGFKKADHFNEPEDHIAIELEFMAHLSQKTLEALQFKDQEKARIFLQKQINFLDQHLIKWVEPFCREVEHAAELGFYKGIAKLTRGFVSLDYKLLEELLN